MENVKIESYLGYDNIQLMTFPSGARYVVKVPENVNSGSGIHLHARGSGAGNGNLTGGRTDDVARILSKSDNDSVVVMPLADYLDNTYEDKAMDIINYVCDEYDITHDNISYSGWSGGAFPALKSTVEYIKQNPDASPQILFTLDDVSPTTYNDTTHPTDNRDYILNNGGREALSSNGTVIFMLQASTQGKQYAKKTQAAYALSDAGANVIRVRIVSCGGHDGINDNFFKKNLEDYATGKAELPDDKYIYEIPVYNEETGEWDWEEIDVEQIKTREQLMEFIGKSGYVNVNIPNIEQIHDGIEFTYEVENVGEPYAYLNDLTNGTISYVVDPNNADSVKLSSDLEFVQSFSNSLVDVIKVEEIENLTVIKSSLACGPLLEIISGYISSYSNSSGQLLDSLAKESAAIMSIGQLFADMDMDLRNDVVEDLECNQEPIIAPTVLPDGNEETVESDEVLDESYSEEEVNEEQIVDEQEQEEQISDEEKVEDGSQNKDEVLDKQTELEEEKNEENVPSEENDKEDSSSDKGGVSRPESYDKGDVGSGPSVGDEANKDSGTGGRYRGGNVFGGGKRPSFNHGNGFNNFGRNHGFGNHKFGDHRFNFFSNMDEQVYEQDGYNVLFGMNDGNIETMKYHYQYGSIEEAFNYYQHLLSEYQNVPFIDDIVLNGTNVEVLFNYDMIQQMNIENLNIDELLNKYFIERIDY